MAVNCEKVVNDLFAAWARLNLDEVMGYFADDAVWDNVPMAPAKGAAAIREMTQGFMKDASAFSAKILKSVHDGNTVFNKRSAPRGATQPRSSGAMAPPASSAPIAWCSTSRATITGW